MNDSDKALGFCRKAIAEHEKVGAALVHAKAAGEWLIKAREVIGVGKWREWASENVTQSIPVSSAYLYIRIAQNWEAAQKAGTIRKARKALTTRTNKRRAHTPTKTTKALAEAEVMVKDLAKHPPTEAGELSSVVTRLIDLQAAVAKALAKLSPATSQAA